jgi:hypothetical protein
MFLPYLTVFTNTIDERVRKKIQRFSRTRFIFSSERSVDEKEFFGMKCRKIVKLKKIK